MQLTKQENVRQAQQYIEQGRVSSAIRIYQQIVDEDPSDLNAISVLGDLYIKAGKVSEAVDHFSRIAGNYLRSGSAKSAAYILNKALKLDATNPRAQMNLGELLLHDKAFGPAHDAFIEAGAAFWREGNAAGAIGMNQRALEIAPDSRHARAALEFIKHEMEPPSLPEQKKRAIAIDLPPIIISIADGSDDVCAPMAEYESQPTTYLTPDFEDLPVQREFVPVRDEDEIVKQIAVAEFLVGCGQVDQAIGVLRESLLDKPDHIQTREKLKDIYLRSEMIDRASAECVNIAAIYIARGETSRAAEYVTRARLLAPPIKPVSAHATPQTDGVEASKGVQETNDEPDSENGLPVQVM